MKPKKKPKKKQPTNQQTKPYKQQPHTQITPPEKCAAKIQEYSYTIYGHLRQAEYSTTEQLINVNKNLCNCVQRRYLSVFNPQVVEVCVENGLPVC